MSVSDKIALGAGGISIFSWLTNKFYGRLTDVAYDKHAKVYEPAATVSIIIPAFNEEDYIEKTLESVLSQNIILSYSDYFECIVIDNESTDDTAEIAEEYCKVISAPRGKLNARHAGIKAAQGDIIVACDADTYYPPNWLNLLLSHFHRPEVVAVHGPFLTQGNLLFKIAQVWETTLLPSLRGVKMSGANSAFRKEAYFKIGGFNLDIDQFNHEQIWTEEEFKFLTKLQTLGVVIFDPQVVCFSMFRGAGRSSVIEQRLNESKYYEEVARGERF